MSQTNAVAKLSESDLQQLVTQQRLCRELNTPTHTLLSIELMLKELHELDGNDDARRDFVTEAALSMVGIAMTQLETIARKLQSAQEG